MMGFVLHESQSQTGYVSVVVGEVLLLVVFPAQRRMLLLLLLPLALGMVAGTLARYFLSVATVDHLTTSQVRWTVLKTSLALFAERPWTGWGVGSFAAVFLERAGALCFITGASGCGCTEIAGVALVWWRRCRWSFIC